MNHSGMQESTDPSVQNALGQFNRSTPEKFGGSLRGARSVCPENVTQACILHLHQHGLDAVAGKMMLWVIESDRYLLQLVDTDLLTFEAAKQVCSYFREADPQFLPRLSRLAYSSEGGISPRLISGAAALLEALGRDNALIPWLTELTEHQDSHVRSRAVKILCALRPDKSVLDRHLESQDPRVRANAVEAMWHVSGKTAVAVFQNALHDKHHRVVANALVGLHYKKDPSAFDKAVELTSHPDPMFRLAMAWVLGVFSDCRAVPALRHLATDPSPAVSQMAQRILDSLDNS